MKIGVTSTGPTLDDMVAVRFGRCPYFLIIDSETMEFEALPNPNISQVGGAGIQSAQLMADRDVAVVLTGNCGPNAIQTFGAAGIQVISEISGPVRQAVQQYISDTPGQTSAPNVDKPSIMRIGRGMGGGRGMGVGGRGMRRGRRR
jgi:predicted Fe-Mo cluster-binding NifX family protein